MNMTATTADTATTATTTTTATMKATATTTGHADEWAVLLPCCVAMWFSALTGLFTLLFGVFITTPYWSVFVCMPLAWCYLLLTLGSKYSIIPNQSGGNNRLFFADMAIAFAIMYCTCNSIVYYVNVTFVERAKDVAVGAVLSVVQQPPPSAFFSIEILGYTYLGISAIFLAYSIRDEVEYYATAKTTTQSTLLLYLVWIHGITSVVGFIIPFCNFVYQTEKDDDNDPFYVFILLGWCAIFIPICVLLFLHYRREWVSHLVVTSVTE